VSKEEFGNHEGKIIVNHEDIRYIVPILIHYTPGSISVDQENQELLFEVDHPEKWSFAKISIINSRDGKENTITATPSKKVSFEIHENSEYWIDAKIRVNGNTSRAYNTIEINSIPEDYVRENTITVPEKQILIITPILIGIAVFGLIKRRQTN
jgi:minor extracellular serine protease Vpr